MLPTVKAKECCCGCTLRTGTLILLWIGLISSAVTILFMSEELLHLLKICQNSQTHALAYYLIFRSCYFLVQSIITMITSVMGIYAVEKNISKYLTPFLYYMGYQVIFYVFGALLVIISPSLYCLFMWGESFILYEGLLGTGEFMVITLVAHLFCIALISYLWIIIRSFRDSMQNNVANRADAMSYSKASDYDEA